MGIDEIRQTRIAKKQALSDAGLESYPESVSITHTIKEALDTFEVLEKEQATITLGGRVMARRGQGGILFVDLYDGTGKMQAVLKKETVSSEEMYDLFENTVDMGDFIEVAGICFVTKRGEKSIQVSVWKMLAKSLQPLPEKWHGLQDTEERYRKRYLDLLVNPELKDIFVKKAKFWQATRRFLESHRFLEVQTPILETTTGGAEARPFQTHHNDFDIDVYLRISVGELWQKRLMAAGFPRTFEIGRVFRNEGSSPEHLQEFTNMEFYAAYMNFEEGISFTENLIKTVVQETFGTLTFDIKGTSVDLNTEWEQIDYVEKIKDMTGVDVLQADHEALKKKLIDLGVKFEGENKERLTDSLWKYCRKQIVRPVWLTGHPKLVSPLSKADPDNPEKTLRVQLILAGAEMTNGFAELNNPLEQKARFEEQAQLLASGDTEAMMPDWEFVEMLEHGMPPAFGQAYGERLFATLIGKPIRETELFPLMKPKVEGEGKKKENEYAVIILNRDAGLLQWQKLNTVSHLTAAFGARKGKSLFTQDEIQTKDNQTIKLNIGHAIMIKDGDTNLRDVVEQAREMGLDTAEFTREMLETTNDKKVIENTRVKNMDDVEYLGVLVYGPKSKVEDLTQKFPLSE